MNPFKKFELWFNLAKKKNLFDPTAFALATSHKNKPFVRMVLLKLILKDGYVFFTNLTGISTLYPVVKPVTLIVESINLNTAPLLT